MKLLKSLFCFMMILFIAHQPSLSYAENLVAIVVANTLPREENMGREYDVLKMIEELEIISEATGLKLDLNIYIHEEYNSAILDKLEAISVNSDDVLFFYYSGHGYRDEGKNALENPWPNLQIDLEEKAIDFQTITDILRDKYPRLLFSIANSCNKRLNIDMELVNHRRNPRTGGRSKPSKVIQRALENENYKKLFLDTYGEVIASSSIPGQYSYRSRQSGSLFLGAFLDTLHKSVNEPKDSNWESILEETIKMTQAATKGRQTPQYQLAL